MIAVCESLERNNTYAIYGGGHEKGKAMMTLP